MLERFFQAYGFFKLCFCRISFCLVLVKICLFPRLSYAVLEPKAGLAFVSPKMGNDRISVRVRISESVSVGKIRGFDLNIFQQKILGLSPILVPFVSANKSSEWQLNCQGGQILLSDQHSKIKQYKSSEPLSVRTPVGFITYGSNPYRDEIKIYPSGDHCEVVNVLDLEKYLDGLVNSEFSSQWNEESIEAQVVAARTYAYFQIQEAKSQKDSHFDLDASVKDQVYNGSLREDFHSSQAAARTKGFVLTAEGGKKLFPIKAFYHSTCGGLTELPENVWGRSSPGFKKKVSCPYCSGSPRYLWDLGLKSSDISNAIVKGVKMGGLLSGWPPDASRVLQDNHLLDISVTQLDQDGRVARIATVWANGKTVVKLNISGAKFRDWVGPSRLKSTRFQVISVGGTGGSRGWTFRGRGNGHGVGLCQWGAKTMGEKGYKMAAILKHYYPDAALRKLW